MKELEKLEKEWLLKRIEVQRTLEALENPAPKPWWHLWALFWRYFHTSVP